MLLKFHRPTLAYLHDLVMTAAALVLAMYLRTGDSFATLYLPMTGLGLMVLLPVASLVFRLFGLYRGIWRYASIADLRQLTKAVTTVVALFVVAVFLVNRLHEMPRSLPVILWFVLMIFLGGPRFLYRLIRDQRRAAQGMAAGTARVPVLLVGTGDGAELFIRAITNDPTSAYTVVGVIDDKGRRIGRSLHGVPVLGGANDLESVVAELTARRRAPQRLILTHGPGESDGAVVRRLFDQAGQLGLAVGRLPSLTEFKEAASSGKIELRAIAVRDLLGRPQAVLNREAIRDLVTRRRVLVTGAGGTIGGELTRQIAALEPSLLLLLDASEYNLYAIDLELAERQPALARQRLLCDVRDADQIERVFARWQPELVFHAAALKHVPLVEENVCAGALTNTIGTRHVADAACHHGALAMVLISTDKAIRPSSVMGATKRGAETYVQALDLRDGAAGQVTRFITVRFGNVLGSSGSVVPLFQRQLERGGPITVTHPEMRRYFMTVEEAVQLVLQASAYGVANRAQAGKVLVLDMGEPVRIVDLAHQMIRLAGYRPGIDVKVAFTGLRPGEKLFEEILSPDELPTRAEADGLFIAAPRVTGYPQIEQACRELEAAARTGDEAQVRALLHRIVPDFALPPGSLPPESLSQEG